MIGRGMLVVFMLVTGALLLVSGHGAADDLVQVIDEMTGGLLVTRGFLAMFDTVTECQT